MRYQTIFLTFIAALFFFAVPAYSIDFTTVDKASASTSELRANEAALVRMLSEASTPSEKSAVLWRLARVNMILGEGSSDANAKSAFYVKSRDYAAKSFEADPTCVDAYCWHCAAVGRICENAGIKEQIKSVGVMLDDVRKVVDTRGDLGRSEIWQTVSEIYARHPMKSNDDAISFARRAIATVPKGEIRVSVYSLLASLLYNRDKSAEKRTDLLNSRAKSFAGSFRSNLDKYAYFEGYQGASFTPAWSSVPLGRMSDRQEAKAIVAWVSSKYSGNAGSSSVETKDFNKMKKMASGWQ